MKQPRQLIPLIFVILAALCGSGLRSWGLHAGTDAGGVPVSHLSHWVYVGVSALCVAAFLLLAVRSPGRSGRYRVLQCGSGGFALGLIAGGLLLIGSLAEFVESLLTGPGISAPIICLLGLLGSICCMIAANFRRKGENPWPATEVLPILYLIVKLIFNFKDWSIDPIILDYCVILFALIFALLAFHRTAGFVFDQGKPRASLFYALCAVYFSAAAMMDGMADLSLATIITYCGFMLWQIPVILCLSVPRAPDPVPEKQDKQSKKEKNA